MHYQANKTVKYLLVKVGDILILGINLEYQLRSSPLILFPDFQERIKAASYFILFT